jgi:hypothetical protein
MMTPQIPQWGVWMMFLASVIGAWFLALQLRASGWRLS